MQLPFHNYPYTDFHELNLEWMLKKIKEINTKVDNFITLNSLVFADPLQWDITTSYATNTIVIDENGDAYLSVKPVPDGVLLSNTEYWIEVFNFSEYVEKANKNLTDHYEKNVDRATANYVAGDWIVWNDVLYKVTADINEGAALVVDTNLEHFTVEDFLKDFITTVNGTILQYKNDIDASEIAYRNQLAQDVSDTTASLQAQLNTAIAGVTVDSEVINARVGADGIAYSTLGDAIRTQVGNTYYRRLKVNNVPTALDVNVSISANKPIYWRPISTTQASVTKMQMYGKTSGGTFEDLGTVVIGEEAVTVPVNNYVGFRVVGDPYVSGYYDFVIDWCQPEEPSLIEKLTEMSVKDEFLSEYFKRYTSNTNNYDIAMQISSGSSISWRAVDANANYIQCYAFKPDSTYDNLGLCRMGEMKTVTASTDYVMLRFVSDPYGITPFTFDLYVSSDSGQTLIKDMESLAKFNMFGRSTCKIFKKVVCCGDSYTSGYIDLGGGVFSNTNEQFAWPHYMQTLTGNEYVNCSASGATVLSWPTDPRGLPKATAAGNTQAYIIGLGLNDVNSVSLGSSTDIGDQNPTTYYGGLAKIVRDLNALNPNAKIFINTMPITGGSYDSFNQAIRDVVSAYENIYPVFLIDLVDYIYIYKNSILVADAMNGHYTAIGYEQFAEIYAYILSNYINQHISDFQDVFDIPF